MHLRRAIATAEVLLIFPSALFMTALFVRNLQPLQYEPAHTAQQIVNWYAARTHLALWGFLIALPLVVFIAGSASLLRAWRTDAALRDSARRASEALRSHFASVIVAAATLVSVGILAIVALHLVTG